MSEQDSELHEGEEVQSQLLVACSASAAFFAPADGLVTWLRFRSARFSKRSFRGWGWPIGRGMTGSTPQRIRNCRSEG